MFSASPWLLAIGLGITTGLALFVQWPTQDVFFCDDSIALPITIDAIRRDSLSAAVPWLTAGNGHHHPLWTFLFTLELDAFGFDPAPWHVTNAIFHGLSAWLAGCLVHRWTKSLLAAGMVSLLWAGTVVGGYDDVSMTIFEAHYPLGLIGVLATLYCWDRYLQERRSAWWWGTALAMISTSLTWFVAWTALVALPIVVWMGPTSRPLPSKRSLLGLALLWLTLGSLQVLIILAQGGGAATEVGGLLGLRHLPGFFAQSLERWTLTDPTEPTPSRWLSLPLLLLGGVLWGMMDRGSRLVTLLLSILPINVVTLTCLARQPGPTIDADYLYYPTFAWCVLFGLGIASVARQAPLVGGALGIGLVVGVVHHSTMKVETTKTVFGPRFEEIEKAYLSYWQLLADLNQEGSDAGNAVRVPNLFLPVQPNLAMPLTLSAMLRWQQEGNLPWVQWVEPSQFSADDRQRLTQWLDEQSSPEAKRWKGMLDEVIPDIQTLVSASRQVSGGAERTALTNVLLHYPHSELVVSTEGLLLQESRQVGGIFFLMNDTAPNLSLLRDLESRLDSAFRRSPEWERFRERYLSGSSDRFPLLAPDPPSRPQ